MENQIEELKILLETRADLIALIKRKLDDLPVRIDADDHLGVPVPVPESERMLCPNLGTLMTISRE